MTGFSTATRPPMPAAPPAACPSAATGYRTTIPRASTPIRDSCGSASSATTATRSIRTAATACAGAPPHPPPTLPVPPHARRRRAWISAYMAPSAPRAQAVTAVAARSRPCSFRRPSSAPLPPAPWVTNVWKRKGAAFSAGHADRTGAMPVPRGTPAPSGATVPAAAPPPVALRSCPEAIPSAAAADPPA